MCKHDKTCSACGKLGQCKYTNFTFFSESDVVQTQNKTTDITLNLHEMNLVKCKNNLSNIKDATLPVLFYIKICINIKPYS